jgi:hypothetical protein
LNGRTAQGRICAARIDLLRMHRGAEGHLNGHRRLLISAGCGEIARQPT